MSSSPTTNITTASEAAAVAKIIEERPLVLESVSARDVIVSRDASGAVAFEDAAKEAQEGTGLQLFYGSPE